MKTYTEAAFLHDGEVTREDYCRACAHDLVPGKVYPTGAECIALGFVEIAKQRSRTDLPSEGILCVGCGAAIIPPFCSRCDFREDECACVEWTDQGRDEHPRPYSKRTGEPV